MKLFIFLAMACLGLCACNAHTPSKPQPAQTTPETSAELFDQGMGFYQRWLDNDDESPVTLLLAEAQLRRALEMQPSNALYQLKHYDAYARLLSMKTDYDEARLLEVFNALNPIVRGEVITPAFVTYTLAAPKTLTPDQRVQHLLRAVRQNPDNPQNWLLLSEAYTAANRFELALASAQQALSAAPGTAYYEYQVGVTISRLLEQSECGYAQPQQYKLAVGHLTQALAAEPDNPLFLTAASRAYLHLGVVPLAYMQAKKAYHAEPNLISARNYFYSVLLGNKPAEMQQVYEYLLQQYPQAAAFEILLAQWRFNQTAISSDTLTQADAAVGSSFHQLNADLLGVVSKTDFSAYVANLDLDSQVIAFVSGELDGATFFNTATNSCDRAQRQFLQAAASWRNGDSDSFQRFLQDVRQQKHSLDVSHLWAVNMLDKQR